MQRTELSLFAQDFLGALAPLGAALERLRACPEAAAALPGLERRLPEVGGELADLTARVAAERAGVFVFGPAKSGKSTLLCALAGTRAAEVGALPSYPCVQRVRHGPRPRAELSAFDGSGESSGDPAGLALRLQRAHGELAAAARSAARAGEAFEPARHLRTALRRVERTLTAELLERTAVELVECPPIHGPLFATYGAMLIGEPEGARAAVLVVRAAQLCDDAVFDGVEELLAAFERPCLVVNLDGASRELLPSGEPGGGLEREDPARLLEAFEQLTTCEPLARALRSGAVPVLAIDLLAAARARLRGEEEGALAGRSSRFADLLGELASVFDGHEAFRALVASALRRAAQLAEEVRELCASPGPSELERRCAAAGGELAALEEREQALARLWARGSPAWAVEEPFQALRERLEARTAVRARELALELALPLHTALEDWFASGESLQDLLQARLAPRVAAAAAELERCATRRLREELESLADLERLSAGARRDFSAAAVALAPLLAPPPERPLELAGSVRPLDVDAIPVRPRLGQRLTFRGEAEVRRGLFGPPEAPERAIPSAEKARALGSAARAALRRSAEERALAVLLERARELARRLQEAQLTAFTCALCEHAERERAALAAPLAAARERVARLSAAAEALRALEQACTRERAALAELGERFRDAGTLAPAPRAATRTAGREEQELEHLPARE